MATFVAKNSGGVKKKPVIILKYFFFRFGFNKRRQGLAGMGVRLRTKSIVTYRVFFLCEATKDAGDLRNYNVTRKSNYT